MLVMQPVYAIIRIDTYQGENHNDVQQFTIKKVVWTLERAQNEVERLNKLNGPKGCRYFWQHTRLESFPLQTADS